MRNDLIESVCIGGCIGILIFAVHMLTASAAPQIRLLALLIAAIVIAACQLGLTIWRERRGHTANDSPAEPEPSLSRLRRNRRNPFFRELTSDWTGLDEPRAEPEDTPTHQP